MPKNMKILELNPNDIGEIQKLWEELNALHEERSTHFKKHFQTFTFEERSKRLLKREKIKIFVVSNGSDYIGYCVSTIENNKGEIDSICLFPEYQGRGIGKELMKKGLGWLEKMGCKSIKVAVAEGNEQVINFYKDFGFKQRFVVLQKV